MKTKRHHEPQFELRVIDLEFNLRSEPGTDFDRVARERHQADADRAAAEQRQQTLEGIRNQTDET